ncbi:MAG TPA: hypothetical protein VHV10_19105, partial [Ktedonobacteraceae bacterium]|nr:hypothetical protein [Ktedonobacteraceae bacterium]
YPEDVQRQINALQEKRSAYIETYLHERKSNEQTNDQLGQQLELSNDAMTAALLQRQGSEMS